MLQISGISSGSNRALNESLFHVLVWRSISSWTSRFGFCIGLTPQGGLAGTPGIQGSSHTRVLYPEPIDFLSPDFSKGLAAIMLRHTYDGELAFSTVIGLVLRKYLPFRTLAKREEGYWISLHSCFASRARLKFLRSLNPKPPFSMGIQIFFHAIQCNPRLFCFVLHQNLAIALVSFLIVSYGKRKHNIT